MKAGTRIELLGTPAIGTWPAVAPEVAKIARIMPDMLPLPPGYHPVRFADGGCVLIHESRFVILESV